METTHGKNITLNQPTACMRSHWCERILSRSDTLLVSYSLALTPSHSLRSSLRHLDRVCFVSIPAAAEGLQPRLRPLPVREVQGAPSGRHHGNRRTAAGPNRRAAGRGRRIAGTLGQIRAARRSGPGGGHSQVLTFSLSLYRSRTPRYARHATHARTPRTQSN